MLQRDFPGALLRLTLTLFASCAIASAHNIERGGHHGGALHFSHPLVTESPSPDTKVRFDYFLANESGADRQTLRFEGEYAFSPSLSLELDAPYTFLNPDAAPSQHNPDNAELALKYANFHFAGRGLLFGGGLELGLPTGSDEKGIGSSHVGEVAPYLDFGYRRDRWQFVGFAIFGRPVNTRDADEEADLELEWNLSALYEVSPTVRALVELNASHANGGEEDGANVVNITPGLKFRPTSDPRLSVGMGISLPLTGEREFESMPVVSVFYHF